jgi:hypothetical protein
MTANERLFLNRFFAAHERLNEASFELSEADLHGIDPNWDMIDDRIASAKRELNGCLVNLVDVRRERQERKVKRDN